MTCNTAVKVEPTAPGVTLRLAEFAATHPSKGSSDAVERGAYRAFAN
jgi:hypothetical protein